MIVVYKDLKHLMLLLIWIKQIKQYIINLVKYQIYKIKH